LRLGCRFRVPCFRRFRDHVFVRNRAKGVQSSAFSFAQNPTEGFGTSFSFHLNQSPGPNARGRAFRWVSNEAFPRSITLRSRTVKLPVDGFPGLLDRVRRNRFGSSRTSLLVSFRPSWAFPFVLASERFEFPTNSRWSLARGGPRGFRILTEALQGRADSPRSFDPCSEQRLRREKS